MAKPRVLRPAKGVNVDPKRVRKAKRKLLIAHKTATGRAANTVADKRLEARERARFYATMRRRKLRRRKIADSLYRLGDLLAGLTLEVARAEMRYDVHPAHTQWALHAIKAAQNVVDEAAGNWAAFSRQRIYYTKMAGSS
jgi:hypothetical protein